MDANTVNAAPFAGHLPRLLQSDNRPSGSVAGKDPFRFTGLGGDDAGGGGRQGYDLGAGLRIGQGQGTALQAHIVPLQRCDLIFTASGQQQELDGIPHGRRYHAKLLKDGEAIGQGGNLGLGKRALLLLVLVELYPLGRVGRQHLPRHAKFQHRRQRRQGAGGDTLAARDDGAAPEASLFVAGRLAGGNIGLKTLHVLFGQVSGDLPTQQRDDVPTKTGLVLGP